MSIENDQATIDASVRTYANLYGTDPSKLRESLGRLEVRENEAGGKYVVSIDRHGNARSVGERLVFMQDDPAFATLFRPVPQPEQAKPASVDPRKLSHAEYRKLRAENPAALGLRAKRR